MALETRNRLEATVAGGLLAIAAFAAFGMNGTATRTTPLSAGRPALRPRLTDLTHGRPAASARPQDEDVDPPEVQVGERLFLETGFAQFFAAHMSGVNSPLAQGDPVLETLRASVGPLAGPFAGMSFAAAFAFATAARLSYEPTVATVERRVEVMGTTLDLLVRMKYREGALAASESTLAEIRRVEALLTTWKPGGELWRVDEGTQGKPVAVSRELADVLTADFAWIPRTQGAFDPTILPLVRAWGLRGKGRIPTAEELAAARRASGAQHFRIAAAAGTVTRLSPDAGIDEGAWGKGYALELAARALKKAHVESAVLDLGGQVLAVGSDTVEQPWRVPVAHPRDRSRSVAELGLTDLSASTSGNSERGREAGGRKIGHILDPHTGEPAPDFGSVTVVGPSAFIADILSTAFFVLGPEKGLELSATLRSEGVANEVLFLVERGSGLDALSSPGFSRLVSWADPRAVHGLTPSQP
jgi:thiamine biosynthesis lipoprotein